MNLTFEEKLDLIRNPNTPPNVLEVLANDEDSGVRYWVAQNPNTPLYILYYFHYKKYLNLLCT